MSHLKRVCFFFALGNLAYATVAHTSESFHTGGVLIDDYSLGTVNAVASAIARDAAGNLYVTGCTDSFDCSFAYSYGADTRWLVRKSADEGRTWLVVDSFAPPQTVGSRASNIAVDSSGRIFAVGTVDEGHENIHCVVRRSQDAGVSWEIVNDVTVPGGRCEIQSLALNDAGEVYIGIDAYVNGVWIIQKSLDHGQTWSTIDSLSGNLFHLSGLATDQSGLIYVVGTGEDGRKLIVRRGEASGKNWQMVDSFVGADSSQCEGNDIQVDSKGVIYVAGACYSDSSDSKMYGVVRRSADQGTTWTTVDYLSTDALPNNEPQKLMIGLNGKVAIAGFFSQVVSTAENVVNVAPYWGVRVSEDQGQNWINLDIWTLSPGGYAYAYGGLIDPQGAILVVGSACNGNCDLGSQTINDWIVKRY